MFRLKTGRCLFSVLYLFAFVLTILFLKRRYNSSFGKNECGMTFMWRQMAFMVRFFTGQYSRKIVLLFRMLVSKSIIIILCVCMAKATMLVIICRFTQTQNYINSSL